MKYTTKYWFVCIVLSWNLDSESSAIAVPKNVTIPGCLYDSTLFAKVFVSSINFNKNERNSFFSVKYCQLIASDIELMIIYGLKGESKFRLRSIKILVIKLCKQGQNSMRDFLVALEILKVFIITMLLMSQKQLLATVISFDGIVLKNFLLTVSTVLLPERSNHVRGFALFRQLQSYFLEIIFRDNNLFSEMLSTITFVRYFLFPKR